MLTVMDNPIKWGNVFILAFAVLVNLAQLLVAYRGYCERTSTRKTHRSMALILLMSISSWGIGEIIYHVMFYLAYDQAITNFEQTDYLTYFYRKAAEAHFFRAIWIATTCTGLVLTIILWRLHGKSLGRNDHL